MNIGQKVRDVNRNDAVGYVVEELGRAADEVVIEDIGKTVAECNPSCHHRDEVIEIVFFDEDGRQKVGISEKIGFQREKMDGVDGNEVQREEMRHRGEVYYYPKSRLEVIDDE